uniref:Uncharacterized protein n=1 Tax=Arundo donax TaxID=35708 RepID=A0A0A9E579_ARUDO
MYGQANDQLTIKQRGGGEERKKDLMRS